ncbi:MAG: enoyl-[acyl-carrier protein] reductase [Acidobacteriota bacterium]|jgi:enoyl-[acyl-carrier protein] reductase I|nr:enoyl-[acyl-carrier protein] reductase [Acidobacteriota bacterium]
MLLENRCGIIFGVANKRSIAWATARACLDAGARLAFSYQNERLRENVEGLTEGTDSPLVQCDVSNPAEVESAFAAVREKFGRLDFLVHSLAFAPREALEGDYVATTREAFLTALDVSAYSLAALSRAAAPLMTEGGSIVSMTYYGAEKVVANYNVMGVAKAALEASTRYLAADLGKQNIRVNALSAGPINTLAARGVGNMNVMLRHHAERAPLRRNVEAREVGNAALFLLSPLASGITGEVLHVDCGYNIMAF